MGYDVTHVMREYTKEIDFIMTATRAGPEDVQERGKVASALTYSLAAAKKRTGKTTSVEDTDLYKLAQAIREAGSQELAAAVTSGLSRAGGASYSRDTISTGRSLSARPRSGPERRRNAVRAGSRQKWRRWRRM